MIQKEHLIDAVICREQDNVLEVSRILRDTQVRHLIILNNLDSPVGIISTVDINNRVVAEEKTPKQIKAQDVMTKGVRTVNVDDTYESAYRIMAQLGTYSIPVLRNGKLIGLLEFVKAFKMKQPEAQ